MKAGEAIRAVMEKDDIGFMELARRAGLASNTLANQLSGERNLSLDKFDRLLIAVGYRMVIVPNEQKTQSGGIDVTGNKYDGKERKL